MIDQKTCEFYIATFILYAMWLSTLIVSQLVPDHPPERKSALRFAGIVQLLGFSPFFLPPLFSLLQRQYNHCQNKGVKEAEPGSFTRGRS